MSTEQLKSLGINSFRVAFWGGFLYLANSVTNDLSRAAILTADTFVGCKTFLTYRRIRIQRENKEAEETYAREQATYAATKAKRFNIAEEEKARRLEESGYHERTSRELLTNHPLEIARKKQL